MCGNRIKSENVFKTRRDRAMLWVHFVKLCKKDSKSNISFNFTLKELLKFNMQYITAMKCTTTHKKLKKLGYFREKMTFSPLCPYTSTYPPLKFGTPSL